MFCCIISEETVQIFELKDARMVPDPFHPYDISYKGLPLIIDNGKLALMTFICFYN